MKKDIHYSKTTTIIACVNSVLVIVIQFNDENRVFGCT